MQIPGFTTQQILFDSERSIVLRCIRNEDSKSVVLKVLHENKINPDEVGRFRHEYNILKNLGASKGSRVCIYMPMIPEAAYAMLACARIGAIHSVVFGGFASSELASRIDDSKAKLLVTASCGFEPGRTVEYKPLVDEAVKLATVSYTHLRAHET